VKFGGVGTDIIFEQLNPYSCRTLLQGVRVSGNVALVGQGREHFQDYVTLPGDREFRTAALPHIRACFEKAEVLKGGMLALKETAA